MDDTPPNWDELIANIGKGKEKKKARVISKITKDEADNRIIHNATPTTDKNKDEIVPQDYTIHRIKLGPTSKDQEKEEFQESS